MRRSSSLLLLLFIIFSATACAQKIRRGEGVSPKKDASLQEILALFSSRSEPFSRGVRALAEIKFESLREEPHSFTGRIEREGEETRVSGFNPLGQTLFRLAVVPGQITLAIPRRGADGEEVISGPPERFFEAATARGFPQVEAAAQMLGASRPVERVIPALEKGDEFVLLFFAVDSSGDGGPASGRLVKKVVLERTDFLVQEEVLYDRSGAPRWRTRFSDWRSVGGAKVPFLIEGEGASGMRLALSLREVHFESSGD